MTVSYKLGLSKTDQSIKQLKGVIFDMDGTLTQPQAWMFSEMKDALNINPGLDILDFVATLPKDGSQPRSYDPNIDIKFDSKPISMEEAERRLQYIESKAMIKQLPTIGVKSTLYKLQSLGIQLGICTRNVPKPVDHFLTNVVNTDSYLNFEPQFVWDGIIVTREFQPPKPSPEPILHIIDQFSKNLGVKVLPNEVLMIGDSIDDMQAGKNAGCGIVLIKHNQHGNDKVPDHMPIDLIIDDLTNLINLLNSGIEILPITII